jgi:hypothetical protein
MKFKEAKKAAKVAKEDSEMETSDDDYIDPSMEVYFKKKDKKSDKNGTAKKAEAKKNEEADDDSSPYESSEESEPEESEQESDSDEFDYDDEDVEMKEDEAENGAEVSEGETEDDSRTKLTPQMIKKWSAALRVLYLINKKS